MVDENKQHSADTPIATPDELPGDAEDYQFPSDAGSALAGEEYQGSKAYSDVPSSSTLAPSGTGALGSRAKRLMMVVVAVLTVIIIMHFINARRAKKNTPEPTAETVQITQKKAPEPKKALPVKKAEPTQKATSMKMAAIGTEKHTAASNAQNVDSVEQRLSQLHQEYLSDQSQIHQLRVAMEHIEDFLTEVQNTMIQMHTQVQVLNRKLAVMQADKKTVQKKKKALVQHKRPLLVYYLKAAVRGRAWLQRANGETMTIKPGDSLKDYGVIQHINPAHGVITTSSGRMIKYAPSDS